MLKIKKLAIVVLSLLMFLSIPLNNVSSQEIQKTFIYDKYQEALDEINRIRKEAHDEGIISLFANNDAYFSYYNDIAITKVAEGNPLSWSDNANKYSFIRSNEIIENFNHLQDDSVRVESFGLDGGFETLAYFYTTGNQTYTLLDAVKAWYGEKENYKKHLLHLKDSNNPDPTSDDYAQGQWGHYGALIMNGMNSIGLTMMKTDELENGTLYHKYYSQASFSKSIDFADKYLYPITYTPTEQDSSTKEFVKDEEQNLEFISSADFDKFVEVKVDNVTLDSSKYTITSGSTKVTLNNDYLKTLDNGNHTLDIVSIDGTYSKQFSVKSSTSNVVYTKFTNNSSPTGDGSQTNPFNYFKDALNAVQDGGTIKIIGNSYINEDPNNKQAFEINKEITIEADGNNATFLSRYAGLIISKNVTFKNITFSFPNSYRNAIFANGYNLTLDNCNKDTTVPTKLNIYGGSYSGSTILKGSNSIINISNDIVDGKIFAGSMGDNSSIETTINIENVSQNKLLGIFAGCSNIPADKGIDLSASGADNPEIDTTKSTDANVKIKISDSKITYVNGENNNKETTLEFLSSSEYENSSLKAEQIDNLIVSKGKYAPTVLPTTLKNVEVSNDALLAFDSLNDNIEITKLSANGTIKLKDSQSISATSITDDTNLKIVFPIAKQPKNDTVYISSQNTTNATISFGKTQQGDNYDLELIKEGNNYKTPALSTNIVKLVYEVNSDDFDKGLGAIAFIDDLDQEIDILEQEIDKFNGVPKQVKAIANQDNKGEFVGWYTDDENNILSTDNPFTPSKQDGQYVATKYWAKFKQVTDITKFNVTFVVNDNTYGTLSSNSIDNIEANKTISVDNTNKTVTIDNKTITATPSNNTQQYSYSFKDWTLQDGSNIPTTLTTSITIQANFERVINKYAVNLSVEDPNLGTISKTVIQDQDYGTLISLDNTTNSIKIGEQTIIATSNTIDGKTVKFKHWLINDDILTTNVTLTNTTNIKAVFEETTNTYDLNISVNDQTLGQVSSNVVNVEHGTQISLVDTNNLKIGDTTIIPTTKTIEGKNISFKHWLIDNVPYTKAITVEKALNIQAVFESEIKTYNVTVSVNDNNLGQVNPDSSFNVDYGTLISLESNNLKIGTHTLTPSIKTVEGKDLTFKHWLVNGKQLVESSTIQQDTTIEAVFSEKTKTYTVSLSVNQNDLGEINVTSNFVVDHNTEITLNGNNLNVGTVVLTPSTKTIEGKDVTFKYWLIDGEQFTASKSIVSNTEIQAVFEALDKQYNVKISVNDTNLGQVTPNDSFNVVHGTQIIKVGDILKVGDRELTPSVIQDSSDTTTRVFENWIINGQIYSSPITIKEDLQIEANFKSSVNVRTIRFYNEGEIVYTEYVNHGSASNYNVIPTKNDTDKYEYTFDNWYDQNLTTVQNLSSITSNLDVYAKFKQVVKKYKITFINWDDSVLLGPIYVEYDQMPSEPSPLPTKTPTEGKTYTFTGWDKPLTTVTKDETYKAQFTDVVNKYTVNIEVEDGGKGYATVTNATIDNVPHGTIISINNNVITLVDKTSTITLNQATNKDQFERYIEKWVVGTNDYVSGMKVENSITIKAVVKEKLKQYEITFLNDDNTLYKKQSFDYGVMPNVETPSKTNPNPYKIYTFDSWAPNIVNVNGNATYKANFTSKDKLTLLNASNITYIISSNISEQVRIHSDYNDFRKVYVDNVELDPINYETFEGSTIIKFKTDYLNTLTEGNYQVKVEFDNIANKYVEPTITFNLLVLKYKAQVAGRTCQDDGYPEGYIWSESKQACILVTKTKTVVNTSVNN